MPTKLRHAIRQSWYRPGIPRLAVCLALAAALSLICGCRTFGFYAQAAKGQFQLFTSSVAVRKLLANPETPADLRQRLQLAEDLRSFAETELELPVDGHYLKYADVQRPYVVWNVEAAPEFSLEPKSWWYPIVGRLDYRGYFSLKAATNYASWLRKKGFDVSVGGVAAYSTLGWFRDPLLNTFVFDPDADLAETLFHELAHQRVFAHGDTDFNEAFATAVGQEGALRWLGKTGRTNDLARYAGYLTRHREFLQLVKRTRLELEQLYGDERTAEGKVKRAKKPPALSVEQLRREKRQILDRLCGEVSVLANRRGSDGFGEDHLDRNVNNARLNSIAIYHDLVPGFMELLRSNRMDMAAFYEAAARLARLGRSERHRQLALLAQTGASNSPPPVQALPDGR